MREVETCGSLDGRGRLPSRLDMARREKMGRKRENRDVEKKKGREKVKREKREKEVGVR